MFKSVLGRELRVGDILFVKWGPRGAEGDTIIKIEPCDQYPDNPRWVGVRTAWFERLDSDGLNSRAIIFPNEPFEVLPGKNQISKKAKRAFNFDTP